MGEMILTIHCVGLRKDCDVKWIQRSRSWHWANKLVWPWHIQQDWRKEVEKIGCDHDICKNVNMSYTDEIQRRRT